MLRLEGAVVHLNETNHLVVSFSGYTGIFRISQAEADVYRAVERARAEEYEACQARARQTAAGREAHRIAMSASV